MPDPVKLSEADRIIQNIRPLQINKNAPTPIYNSKYAQQFEGLPFNNETLASGVLENLAYTTESWGSQMAKHAGAALVNTVGFAASTLASIPNIIDNKFNDGNDRIVKPINQMQNAALEDLKVYEPFNNSEQSLLEYATPSWISGNSKSFWGDVVEQSGIIAGTYLGTSALLGAAKIVPGVTAGEAALGNVVKGALSKVIKPTTLLAENLGMSKGIANTINSQKFINGLVDATKQVGINAVQSYTEALFEGLDGEKNFIDSKINEYQTKYGYTPEGKELEDIKKTGEDLKNARFGLNMAGLMISNTSFTKAFFGGEPVSWLTRFDRIGQTMDKTGKMVTKELSFLKNAPSYISKPINFVAARMPLAYSEGLEEVYQMGLEKGLDNYYSNKLNTKDFEANYDSISKALGVGIDSVLTKEGLKAFITGAGVGSIFQGIGNYRDKKSLDKFLDETTEYIDPATKEPIKITNREDAVRNLNKIDESIGDLFSTNPYEQNPVSLNQTLGERVQQFVTDNNNYQDSLKVQGSYLEYDQAQKARFDSLFPYIKKGYKDVIVSKIEGIYQDLNKEELSDEDRQNLANNKQQALQDINTVEKFTRTVDNVFFEQYGHPILDQAQRQLKDIAAFHLWNINSLDKQKKELIDIYGDNIFQDEIVKDYKGDNIEALLNKEITKVQPLSEDLDPYKEQRLILEKIKTGDNPTEAYFAYKQKDKDGTPLTSNDFLILKKQREALDKRVFENNSVFQNLQNLKTDPFKALMFLKQYYGEAEAINKDTSVKEKKIETKVDNKELIKKTIASENIEDVEKELDKKMESPLTATQIKEAEATVKKIKTEEEKKVKKLTKAYDLKIGDKIKINNKVYTIKEIGDNVIKDSVKSIGTIITEEGYTIKNPFYAGIGKSASEWMIEKVSTGTSPISKTIEQLEKEIADIRAKEQEEYSKASPSDDMFKRGVIYNKYNKILKPLLQQLEKLKPAKIGTENRIIELNKLKELIANTDNLTPIMDDIFKIIDEKKYEQWQETLDQSKLEADLKIVLEQAKSEEAIMNILTKYLLPKYIEIELKALLPPVSKSTLNKPKELRNGEENDANSLTTSKIFSSNTAPTSVQKQIEKIEAARDAQLANQKDIEEQSFNLVISEEEYKQQIINFYEEQIQTLRADAILATKERRLEGNTDGATITSTVLPSSQSNLYYDVGLIRTQLHNGPKEIYTINLKDNKGENVPVLTVQNNKDNLLLDIKVLNEFIAEHSLKQEHASKMDILKSLNYTENVPFVKFLEDLIVHPEGEEVFKYIQNNIFTTKSEIEHSEKISQIGSRLKLFNFKHETLESLYRQLYGENAVYKILNTTPNPSFADISGMFKFNFVNKISNELPGYDVTVAESGAEGIIRIETTPDGKSITRNKSLKSEDIIKFQDQDSHKNLRDGFYALFKTSRDTFFPVGVRTSQTYEDLSEAGKNSFKLAMYYGKNRDDFYNVEKKADGSFSVKNSSKEGTDVYKDFDTFTKWVEKTRIEKDATVSFLENNKSTLEFLFNKARVNYKGFKNNFVKVEFIFPINIENNITKQKMKAEKTDLNEILEETSGKPINLDIQITKKGETVSLKSEESNTNSIEFSIDITKKGVNINLKNIQVYENMTYHVKPGITIEQIQHAINNTPHKVPKLIIKDIIADFYTLGTPSYSTISEYQINKIKEFIEKC